MTLPGSFISPITLTEPGVGFKYSFSCDHLQKESQASRSALEDFCLEFFVARHQRKIKFCLLRIAEKEILADVDPEDLVNTVAGIDRECGFVVDAGVGDIQRSREDRKCGSLSRRPEQSRRPVSATGDGEEAG